MNNAKINNLNNLIYNGYRVIYNGETVTRVSLMVSSVLIFTEDMEDYEVSLEAFADAEFEVYSYERTIV